MRSFVNQIPLFKFLQIPLLALSLIGMPLFSYAAVFGADDRQPVQPASKFSQMATGTAIALLTGNYKINGSGLIDLDTDLLDQFCPAENFYKSVSLSNACTGFLVAPELLVTAGHCLSAVNTPHQEIIHSSVNACQSFDWLFDYQIDNEGIAQTKNISRDKLFHCKEIIYAVQQEKSPYLDYALIKLDRPALGRFTYKMTDIMTEGLGPSLSMMGFPFGLPLTRTAGARILMNNPQRSSFITNLNAFEGNSGSPVLDEQNHVVGILIAGNPQANTFVDPSLKCERWNFCDSIGDNCAKSDLDTTQFPSFQMTGSEVQRISPLIQLLKSQ